MENKIISHNQFREIFISHYSGLCKFSEILLKDADDAEEIVQSVFLKIWEGREKLYITSDIKSYLFRSVYNLSLNFIKRQKLSAQYVEMMKVIPHNYDQNILAEIEVEELKEILNSKFNQLSEGVKEAFIMSRVEGFKNREIAEKLNISIKTVEGRITKALFVLKLAFEDYS